MGTSEPSRAPVAPPIPVVVVGGYLGAGKTTLVNRLLRGNHGLRIAVLVNDFGSVNIDAALIASRDGDTISLANGCLCCSLVAGFTQVMWDLSARDLRPDLVVVEASGVADPHKIGQYGHLPGFRLDGVVVLADAETVRARSRDKYVGATILRQLRGADLVVITKPDLVDPAALRQLQAWLQAVSPGLPTVVATQGDVPLELLLGAAEAAPARPIAALSDDPHTSAYDTVTIRRDGPIVRDAFDAFRATLPVDLLRGKGFVHLEEDPANRYLYQQVGRRWSLTSTGPWGAAAPCSEIVLIALPGQLPDGMMLD